MHLGPKFLWALACSQQQGLSHVLLQASPYAKAHDFHSGEQQVVRVGSPITEPVEFLEVRSIKIKATIWVDMMPCVFSSAFLQSIGLLKDPCSPDFYLPMSRNLNSGFESIS